MTDRAEKPAPPKAPHRYDASLADVIETRWQQWWDRHDAFRAPNPGEPGFDPSRPKFYCLDMFPYPSGAGLHVGHPEGYTATDIICRYKRMKGFNVLHPMGWDAFGLPAEQYAIQTGVHPVETTREAIDNFRRQLKRFGFSYDWSREFGTIDPDYYRWTQWIFLRLYHAWYDPEQRKARPIDQLVAEFESGARPVRLNPDAAEYAGAGDLPGGTPLGRWDALDEDTQRMIVDSYRLAYVSRQTVNWCPKLGTALANEEVIDGKSERGGYPVFRKPMRQWMLRITAYADRLLEGLETVDWPESTKTQQAEWIGRSEGAEIDFAMLDRAQTPTGQSLRVFTTRPDTIFGATYMVVAPEHPLVDEAIEFPATGTDEAALRRYAHEARNRSDVERMETREKSGVFTGYYVTNPATRAPIPVWTSDYVLMGYGTGAIMAVPAHDQRDGEFAAAFDLPVRTVVEPPAGEAPPEGRAFTGGGIARNSANDEVSLDGLPTPEAKARIVEWLEAQKLGRRRVNYRLRDWLFSRQRYWGEPFPIVWDQRGRHHPVAESALPVTLPDMADYAPVESEDPQPLLAKAEAWVRTTAGEARAEGLDPESPVTRETNTMPGWAGSCWYYLRYCDPRNNERFVGDDAERYWMGGGIDRRRSALRADAPEDLPVDRRSEPMREEPPNRIAQSTQLIRRGIPRTQLDTINDAPIAAAGFVPRDPYPPGEYGHARDLSKTARNLPHFEMPDATYFVTWRTSGERTLTGAERDTVLNSLLHFDDDRCRVYALCVMPDHVHWLVRPLPGHTLAQLVSSVKRFSARAVNDAAGSEGSLWQPDRFDHVVRDSSWFREFLEYIVHNPVEANMCERPSEYPWLFVHQDVVSRPESEKSTLDVERDATHPSIGSESRSTRGGVDLYIGGAEHAVLHLLYARFWHKVLFDLGHVSTEEPFQKLFHQGLITSHAYQRADKTLVPIDEVETDEDGRTVERATGQHVTQIVAKMSKSLKNVVNPDDVIRDFGADTFRLYEMYMGPLEASKPWNTNDTIGLYRFLQRAWRLAVDEQTGELKLRNAPDDAIERQLHRTIAKVGADIERLAFNTAIAAMIELVNAATASDSGAGGFTRDQLDRFARVLAPFAPHMGEELWHRLGHETSVAHAAWPPHDEAMLRDDQVEIAVQVMGKVRARLTVPADADAETLKTIAMADPAVAELIAGKTVRKVVAVPGRLVNIVAN